MPEDRVQTVSRRKDGTPDQSENFEIIGDKETAIEANGRQLGEMKVSAADEKRAQEQAAANTQGEASLSPEEQARKDEHDKLMEEGRAEAEAEVNARLVDTSARQTEPEKATTRRSRSTASTE